MNSLLFSSSFCVNSEPVEQNLNSIFANKYMVKHNLDRKITINYEKL